MSYENGTANKNNVYRALRNSRLKEMYMVRYADDFKIFCRKRSDADKIFIAVKKWLKERLKLEVSEEKSKVVNLKKHKSKFLGFELRAVRKRNKFAVESYMSQKAMKQVTENLKRQVKKIQHSRDKRDMAIEINCYNIMVVGIHNYYKYATHISCDCEEIYGKLRIFIYNRLWWLLKKSGTIHRKYIAERYGKSKRLMFISDLSMIPVSYIQTKFPRYKKARICKYSPEGREEIHKTLKFDENVIKTMHLLAKAKPYGRSIEYMDNRISLYAAQYGKCAVTGKMLWIDEIHCHHKKPISQGGTDEYKNLVIIHTDVHRLIHAVKPETIKTYLNKIKPNKSQLDKVNKFRVLAGNAEI